jgi:hypothetical protein
VTQHDQNHLFLGLILPFSVPAYYLVTSFHPFILAFDTAKITIMTHLVDGKAPRDWDELDGTLLPLLPTATLVQQSTTTEASRMTFPNVIGAADNDDDIPEAYDCQYEESTTTATATATMPTAWHVPSCEDHGKHGTAAKATKTTEATRRATEMGLAKADAEQMAIAKASRDIYALQYHAKKKVEQANAMALAVDKTRGVQIQPTDHKMNQLPKEKISSSTDEKEEYAFKTSASGGYEVAEYDISEYTGGNDYEISEYKSVYD